MLIASLSVCTEHLFLSFSSLVPRSAPFLIPAIPFSNGVAGWITGKNFALKDPDAGDDDSKAVAGWMNSCLVMWSVFAYIIWEGKDAFETMKYVMAVFLLQLIDINFIRKTNIKGNEPKVFFAVQALLTYLFWTD